MLELIFKRRRLGRSSKNIFTIEGLKKSENGLLKPFEITALTLKKSKRYNNCMFIWRASGYRAHRSHFEILAPTMKKSKVQQLYG